MPDALTPNDFKQHVAKQVAEARQEFAKRKFSDVIDSEGHQYIDYVMEGGGVLGVALLGYTYLLEQVGIRFLGVAGTSAGSITALMLAAADVPAAARSDKLIELVANMPMGSFVDGRDDEDADAQDFVAQMQKRAGIARMIFSGMQIVDNLTEMLAINRGDAFQHWAEQALDSMGVSTTRKLRERMATAPAGLATRDGKPVDLSGDLLAIVAADVSTETKVEFPRMAGLYWPRPDEVHPSRYARASMSIPVFFRPYALPTVFRNEEHRQMWCNQAGFSPHDIEMGLPSRCLFVDGGVLSNFPIDIFHKADRVPSRPTFGVKLQWDERKHEISRVSGLLGQVFNSARHCLDYDFIRRNPDYQHLVAFIDTGEHDWLNFNLDRAGKLDLFARGVDAAIEFLRDFDWPAYKELRGMLADGNKAAATLKTQRKARRIARQVNGG